MVGAYIARDVYVDMDSTVTYQSGVGPSGCLQSCDDSNPCTTDTCSAGTCVHALVAAGTSCADNNACNGEETCDGQGHCKAGTPVTCPAPDQCHTLGTCNQTTGLCSNPAKPDGTACNDGNPGSQGDVCTVGVCQGTIPCASAVDVHVGNAHTCAVRTDGSLWCWGLNSYGQLGNGTTDESSVPIRAGATTWNWAAVTTGALHSCGIRRDGTLWCWGDNESGQLGNGTTDPASTPTQVVGQNWMLVQAGLTYTCGVQTNGSLWCWGGNAHGALGNGTQSNSNVPVEVLETNWVSVAAGSQHTCGIKADQTLWCWGANADGALGNGGKVDSLTPVQVGGATWYSVAVGGGSSGEHTCAVKLDGSLWCWGANSVGQLGTGSTTASLTPVRVGSATWTSVSAGIAYTCGVQGDGTLWCWGSNDNGQLGDGTETNRLAPVRVPGQGWTQVVTRNLHTCGTRPDGSLWCWGNNTDGEIGDGQTASRLTPEQVVGQLCSQVPICGNSQVEQGEQCDDGNNTSGDGCAMDCQIEKCFRVDCTATDQCRLSFCDPATGGCLDPPKNDGTECDDGDLCTQKDTCQAGECKPGSPVECAATECYAAGTCDSSTGICSKPPIDKVGCNIHLRVDGVADMGNGKYIAIFGYYSGATDSYRPATNTVSPQSSNPTPAYLLPGLQIAAFLPTFDGPSISWTVDDETVTATYDQQTALQPQTVGTGSQVVLPDGTTIMVTPDFTSYESTPGDPGIHGDLAGSDFKGTIPGQLTVGPSGAAVYTVPISIPPGIAGMAPNLNLVYNSQGGDGIAGQGWDLTGLSVIHRCAKTKLQDGVARPVSMDATPVGDFNDKGDAVCLDGKRLFHTTLPGAQMAAFETEMKDFSQITLDATDTFTVATKTGEKRFYGSTDKSRVPLPMEGAQGGQTVIAMWALDRVEDPWGNYYEIHYNNENSDFDSRGLIVTEIKYTGHTDAPFSSVSFSYEPRPDVRHLRFHNSVIPKNQRLTAITTDRGNYQLTYKAEDEKNPYDPNNPNQHNPFLPSRLSKISYCSTSAPTACLQDLEFDWQGGDGYGWTSSSDYSPPDVTTFGTQFIDLNADGLADIVHAEQLSSTTSTSTVWQNTGTGWQQDPTGWTLPTGVFFARPMGQPGNAIFADFDGDGLPDLITDNFTGQVCDANGQCDDISGQPAVWFNRLRDPNGPRWLGVRELSGANLENKLPMPDGPSPTGGKLCLSGCEDPYIQDRVLDIDGDGKAELIRIAGRLMTFDNGGSCPVNLVYVFRVVNANAVPNWDSTVGGASPNDWSFLMDPSDTTHGDLQYSYPGIVDRGYPAGNFGLNFSSFADINRDGLPDLVGTPDTWGRGTLTALNTGKFDGGDLHTIWKLTWFPSGTLPAAQETGDIDGDGQYDWAVGTAQDAQVVFSAGFDQTTNGTESYLDALAKHTRTADANRDWLHALNPGRAELVDVNGDGLVDLVSTHNFGGQLLVNTGSTWVDPFGYSDFSSFDTALQNAASGSSAVVPQACLSSEVSVPGTYNKDANAYTDPPINAFMDLNGDGLPDRVQMLRAGGYTSRRLAALNGYSRPVIRGFPNGQASATQVEYATITTANAKSKGVYTDSNGLLPGTTYVAVPLQVVGTVSADNGKHSTATTSYQYRNLRASTSGRGPQGFEQVAVTDPTGLVTTTTYAQVYPYTGMPTSVTREQTAWESKTAPTYCSTTDSTNCTEAKVQVAKTETTYCDNVAAAGDSTKCTSNVTGAAAGTTASGVFVYPLRVKDTSLLRGSTLAIPTATATTTTEYVYDERGNPTTTTVTTTTSWESEGHERKIVNTYDNEQEGWSGKPNSTVVTAREIDATGNTIGTEITHTTAFEYRPSPTFALAKKKVEPTAEVGIQLHTAYDYDDFGNLITTTICASDFGNCEAGADNPQGDPSDPNHPQFRTTSVSYDPNRCDRSPARSDDYLTKCQDGKWRYPVRTTNALGQAAFSTYDPLLGVLIQNKGPNGISTCYDYDTLGYQRSETARCGSQHELTTTITRYLVSYPGADSVPLYSKTLTVTEPPTGATRGVYADVLGRTLRTVTRNFEGNFIYTDTTCDNSGRVQGSSKPFVAGSPYQYWTWMDYDWFGRVSAVTQQLGPLAGDDFSNYTATISTTTYSGSQTTTQQTVNSEVRQRSEWRNGLGKVSHVQDAAGNQIWYAYDPDGNLRLTDTADPSQNSAPTANAVNIHYDVLGRKDTTIDPDLGKWTYVYNGFGDLISQTDAKNQTTKMAYDKLGRMTTKSDATGNTAEWVYDKASWGIGKLAAMISAPDSKLNAPCSVPNTTQTSGNRAGRSFTYTSFGEVNEVTDCTDGKSFVTTYGYDDRFGRQNLVTYPEVNGSRFAVEYHYTSSGFLQYVADASDHKPYWVANQMNAAGQVDDESTRNWVRTYSILNPSTGWLLHRNSTAEPNNETLIQELQFTYDEAGNLRTRARSMTSETPDSNEIFGYDSLDRLKTAQLKIPSAAYDATETYDYDSLGNLTQKAGKAYTYTGCATGGGPHAVCTVAGGTPFQYDANGNMTSGKERTVEYNPANKPIHIDSHPTTSQGNDTGTVDFVYGADGHRVVQSAVGKNGESARTVYVGLGATGRSLYERTTHATTGETEHVHFIYAGGAHKGNAFALHVITEGGQATTPPATRYNLFDHLGSVTAITDEMGHVLGPTWGGADATMASYDAWGARRSFDGSAASPASFNLQVGHREFTGHEAVPNVGLVNMNGRVYDPELGRFLSPDPSVQFVADLQSYNRYTYAANNPLRYTDPTGYSWYSFLTSTSFWVGFGEASLAALACAGGPEACMGVGLFLAVANSSAALVQGAPPGQVALGLAMGLLAGQFGGAAGGEIGTGTSPWIIAGGALGGMLSGAMMTPVMGGSLGRNMLIGAASGAASAAITWSLQGTNPVSQASAAESQGGGGSGADQVAAANQEAATKGQPAEEEVREFGASARDSIARENYQFAIANMDAAGELGGPALGADGQPLRTAWTFEVTASVNINIGPVNINYSVGLAGDSNGGLAITRTGGGGAGVGSGGSAGVGWDVSNGASVDDLAGPFATTQTSAGLGPSASTSGYTGTGSQGQQIAGTGWSVGAGAGGGTYSGGSVTKVVRIW